MSERETLGRREEIVAAALACFERNGVEGTTIANIRAASGASVGSIYHHFGEKVAIAGRVYLEVLRRYQESYLKALSACRSGEDAVKTTVRHYLDWVMRNKGAARLLIEARHAPQVMSADSDIRKDTKRFLDAAQASLQRFVGAGEVRALPPAVLTAILIAPAAALAAEWLRKGDARALAEQRELLADAAWRALRADKVQSKRRAT